MRYNVGDFVLLKEPLFGYKKSKTKTCGIDLGPFEVEITEIIDRSTIRYNTYFGNSTTSGTANASNIIDKLHCKSILNRTKE